MRKLKLEELGRITPDEYKVVEKITVTVVLDNIRSAMNVGSFFRTADAFKIEKIILTGITARPPHKEILKTAIGATLTVEWSYEESVKSALTNLKLEDYTVIGIEQTDKSIALQDYIIDTDQKYALIFGNEVDGISDDALDILDASIEIPQFGTKHSLNVSVCGGIVLWHFAIPYL
jgi:tRNA G18 (ribose-2'-O)-methylase SpoU